LLNSEEFKQPLQLAPVALGQILSVAAMVKKTFTNVEDDPLMATYPGIISADPVTDPIALSRLVEGNIIVILKQDDSDQLDFEPAQLTVSGNRVLSRGEPIPNTYLVYNVSFDKWRGIDPTSAWARKFADASSKVDELMFAPPEQKQSIVSSAHDLLMQGKGVLDADDSYRTEEKTLLATAAFRAVADKIKANVNGSPVAELNSLGSQVKSYALLAAEVEPPAEASESLSAYASDLAAAGMPLGFVLDADDVSPGTPALPSEPAAEILFLGAHPLRAAAAAPASHTACPVQSFFGISAERWNCLREKAGAAGIVIADPEGEASQKGVTIGWKYDASGQSLEIACKQKPFLVPCSVVNSKLRDLVDNCSV
jgi:hypothetical protein